MNTPWFSTGAVEFLEEKLQGFKPTCFEWGCGGSTLWFSARCRWVFSVEHDLDWANKIRAQLPDDQTGYLIHISLSSNYWNIAPYVRADIVVIDGRHRKACAEQVAKLDPLPSLVIWDDAQRHWYQCSMGLFPSDRWAVKDFVGGQPGDQEKDKTTRLFIRRDGMFQSWI